jgi:hypothetical protein
MTPRDHGVLAQRIARSRNGVGPRASVTPQGPAPGRSRESTVAIDLPHRGGSTCTT